MRPDSIKKFDLFYLGSIIVGLANGLIFFDNVTQEVGREFARQGEATASALAGYEGAFALGTLILGALISLLLWFLISRQKVGLVRWIIALLTAWNLLSLPGMLRNLASPMVLIGLAAVILQVIAVFYLFKTETTVWLKGKTMVDADGDGVADAE